MPSNTDKPGLNVDQAFNVVFLSSRAQLLIRAQDNPQWFHRSAGSPGHLHGVCGIGRTGGLVVFLIGSC